MAESSHGAIKDAMRGVVREELDHAVGMLFTPTQYHPPCADVHTERTLLSGILAGWATAQDLVGLEADDFYHPVAGGVFTLAASPVRGGTSFSLEVMAHALSRMGAGPEHRVQQWIDQIILRCPVVLAPSLREQAKRIVELARWRRFFKALSELEARTCLSVSMGREPATLDELRSVLSILTASPVSMAGWP